MREKKRKPEPPSDPPGDRIARLRKRKGWNQTELAERIGVRANQISKYEQGAYLPKPAVLGPLAEALGTTVDYLLTGHETKVQRDQRLRNLLPRLESPRGAARRARLHPGSRGEDQPPHRGPSERKDALREHSGRYEHPRSGVDAQNHDGAGFSRKNPRPAGSSDL